MRNSAFVAVAAALGLAFALAARPSFTESAEPIAAGTDASHLKAASKMNVHAKAARKVDAMSSRATAVPKVTR